MTQSSLHVLRHKHGIKLLIDMSVNDLLHGLNSQSTSIYTFFLIFAEFHVWLDFHTSGGTHVIALV